MISVIVISYNQERYIEQCLKSIIEQVVDEKIEILIGDDASEDNTPNIIKKYEDKYPDIVKPVFRKSNIGATKNLLDLLNKAHGDYIAFCEGDDYWVGKDKLERQVNFLYRNHTCYGVVHSVIVVDKFGNECKNQKLSWLGKNKDYCIYDFKGVRLPSHLSSLLFRKNVIEDYIDFDILFCDKNLSDKMIFLLVLSKGKIGFIYDSLSAYRFIRDSLSNNLVAKMQAEKRSFCVKDMRILNAMDLWLTKNCGIKKQFLSAQSRVLVTALFHKLKGYDVSFFEVWNMCNHKYLALARFPIAFIEQFIQKIKVVAGIELR